MQYCFTFKKFWTNKKFYGAYLHYRLSRSSSLIHLNNQKVVSEKETAKVSVKNRFYLYSNGFRFVIICFPNRYY